MTKKVILSFLLLFSNLSASWQDNYAEALKAMNENRYTDAEFSLDRALDCERVPDYVYVDRASLYLMFDRYTEALSDLNYAINEGTLSTYDLTKAYGHRMIARASLDQEDLGAMDDLRKFGQLNPLIPKIERGNKTIVIKNAPNTDCYRKMMTCYFIHSGQCQSKRDIQILDSGDWIINKSCDCGCKPKKEKFTCDACGMEIGCGPKADAVISCKKWCDRVGIGAGILENTYLL